MKLIICMPGKGHEEATAVKDIEDKFNKIIKEGYGGRIPPVFFAEFKDGSLDRFNEKEAKEEDIIHNPEIEIITVTAPMAGG